MKWFLSLFSAHRALEAALAESGRRLQAAEVHAAWAQKKLDDFTASEREAWREAVRASQMGADLAAQYGFGRPMFGVGPEVAKRKAEVQHVPGPRNMRDIMHKAQDEILRDIETAESRLMESQTA